MTAMHSYDDVVEHLLKGCMAARTNSRFWIHMIHEGPEGTPHIARMDNNQKWTPTAADINSKHWMIKKKRDW